MTNFEKIKSMSIEEIVDFIQMVELGDLDYSITFCDMCEKGGNTLNLDCNGCIKQWLESEVE